MHLFFIDYSYYLHTKREWSQTLFKVDIVCNWGVTIQKL